MWLYESNDCTGIPYPDPTESQILYSNTATFDGADVKWNVKHAFDDNELKWGGRPDSAGYFWLGVNYPSKKKVGSVKIEFVDWWFKAIEVEKMIDSEWVTVQQMQVKKTITKKDESMVVAIKNLGKFSQPEIEEPTLDGTYAIRSLESNLYLNINIGDKKNGGKIYQWDYPQEWILAENIGSKLVDIRSVESNLYLNINIGRKKNGGKIHQWDYPQKWMIEKHGFSRDGFQIVAIRSVESNLYLNIDIGDKKNGGKIHQWDYPQKWELVRK